MKHLKSVLAAAAVAVGICGSAHASTVLYGIDNNTDSVVTIDITTGAVTVLGAINSPSGKTTNYNALAFDSSGSLFSASNNPFGPESELLMLDPTTGQEIGRVSTANAIDGLTFSGGTLYGLTGAAADDLVSIDPTTGTPTFEVSLGAPIVGGYISVNALATAADGTIYGYDGFTRSLLTIDPSAGATVIATGYSFSMLDGLAFDDTGRLFASTTGLLASLMELDPLTGAVLSSISLDSQRITGIAFSPMMGGGGNSVPLPAAAFLFAPAALGAMGLRRRKAKAA